LKYAGTVMAAWLGVHVVGDELLLFLHLLVLATHEPLDGEHGVLRVRDRLTARDLADESLAVLRERHHRRRGPTALGVGDHDGLAALHDRDHRVRGAEVDPDDFAHALL
jgi:hypothetical protein